MIGKAVSVQMSQIHANLSDIGQSHGNLSGQVMVQVNIVLQAAPSPLLRRLCGLSLRLEVMETDRSNHVVSNERGMPTMALEEEMVRSDFE